MTSRTGKLILIATALAAAPGLATAGCAGGQDQIEPPEISYGEDICAECSMIISDPRFAAAYVYQVEPGRYETLAFGDIGDMLSHAAASDHDIVAWYVHDYESLEWLDATTAYYVFSPQLETPMASGVAAWRTREAAEAKAISLDGQVLDWESLRARHAAGELNTGQIR